MPHTLRISINGSSEYKLNNKVVPYSTYNNALIQHNILVKAKNFLVFQGDVEAVASQSPKDLSRLIDQISGSLELAGEYEKAKEAQDRATENATFNFTKRRKPRPRHCIHGWAVDDRGESFSNRPAPG